MLFILLSPLPREQHAQQRLDDVRLSVRAAAERIGVSHNALANVIRGDSAVTAEMALRIGTLCGNGPELWPNLQRDYDLWHASAAIRKSLAEIQAIDAPGR